MRTPLTGRGGGIWRNSWVSVAEQGVESGMQSGSVGEGGAGDWVSPRFRMATETAFSWILTHQEPERNYNIWCGGEAAQSEEGTLGTGPWAPAGQKGHRETGRVRQTEKRR